MVIGNNRYRHLENLETAQNDARSVTSGQPILLGQPAAHRSDRNLSRLVEGIAVDSSRDRRKGDRGEAVALGQLQAAAVGAGQQVILVLGAALPDRPDRVDDVARLERKTGGDARAAGRTAADGRAGRGQFRPRGAVNRATDTAAGRQVLVGRVDNGDNVELRNVALIDLNAPAHE